MMLTEGILRIAQERERQVFAEGFTLAHDNQHTDGELPDAAACYADIAGALVRGATVEELREFYIDPVDCHLDWPWDEKSFKPVNDPVRCLEMAGALIAAELDRIVRLRKNPPVIGSGAL